MERKGPSEPVTALVPLSESGFWAGDCKSAKPQAKECRSAREMSIVGLGSCRHLQSCSEIHIKQFLQILCRIKKLEEGKDICQAKHSQTKNCIFTLRNVIRK